MSPLCDHTIAEARKLPDSKQDANAVLILDEIADDRRWKEVFTASPGKLAALAAHAAEQVRAGRCQAARFDARCTCDEIATEHPR